MPREELSLEYAFKKTLNSYHKTYNEEEKMIFSNPSGERNYHSVMGLEETRTHQISATFIYAAALLCTGDAFLVNRGQQALDRVLDLQDKSPDSPTYGVWPYVLEEPLDQMLTPDWNMADFNAKVLLGILAEHAKLLSEECVEECKKAILRACASIINRGVGVDYTNINIMDSYILLHTGEMFSHQEYILIGRKNLQKQWDFVTKNGGFMEYNSPTYTILAIEEIGRIIKYCTDKESLRLANKMNYKQWECIAVHYHKNTRQLSGPHSRCYNTLVSPGFHSFLEYGTSRQLQLASCEEFTYNLSWPYMKIVCPVELFPYFTRKQEEIPREYKEQFYSGYDPISENSMRVLLEKGTENMVATTYLTPDYSLGSFCREDLWSQRRPLLAYFLANHQPAYFRLRVLQDNEDFCGAILQTIQHENQIVAGINFVKDHGDYHFILTPLKNESFSASRLAIRFELGGKVEGLDIQRISNTELLFSGDTVQITLKILYSSFKFKDTAYVPIVTLKSSKSEKWAEIVLYEGEEQVFDLNKLIDGANLFSLIVSTTKEIAPSIHWHENQESIVATFSSQSMIIPKKVGLYVKNSHSKKEGFRGGFIQKI